MRSRLSRRAVLAGASAMLATPAVSQVKGPFDVLGPDSDPNDLIDQIWDPEREAFITVRELIDRLVDTEIILVGERHCFSPHQDRAAFLLKALADRGRYPTLALEMLEPADEPIVAAYRAQNPEYARRLGVALDWANSGWPDWRFYEPIFDAAFAAKLPIVGADLPLLEQQRIEREGTPDRPEDPWILESWKKAMFDAHCGLIDEERTLNLALTQWKRDVAMAAKVDTVANGESLFLGGREHLRDRRGLPNIVRSKAGTLMFASSQIESAGALTWFVEAPVQRTLC